MNNTSAKVNLTAPSATYDYVLKVVNQVSSNWTVNLQVYNSTNIGRVSGLNISLRDGTASNQIAVIDGSVVKSEGEPYFLPSGLGSTLYVSASNLSVASVDISYLHIYLKIQEPNTSTYILFIITFEIK